MRNFIVLFFAGILWTSSVAGQDKADPAVHADSETAAPSNQSQHDMRDMPSQDGMNMDMGGMNGDANMAQDGPAWLPSPESGSGTAWQPAATPDEMWMTRKGAWNLMMHGVVFLDYNQQRGPRGEGKAESVNWAMLMERRKLGDGSLLFREMFSAESLTAPHPGFPELFQTGETYHGEALVDHQHPHNVFAELSLDYTHPLGDREREIAWEFYGAAAGEPALGPVAYMHRASAAELPLAPLSHHLQDSTHTSFGVLTTGLLIRRVKIEGSVFNGREPDEKRYSLQFAALDSWATRVSVAAFRNLTAEYSYGRLEHPEALEPGSQRRQTASMEYVRPFAGGSFATSLVWGRVHNILDNHHLNSYLLETTANVWSRNYAFARLELVDKDALFPADPALPGYRIGAYTLGGAHDLIRDAHWRLALGADFTVYSKPPILDDAYGQNPVSFQVFLRVRPAAQVR